MSDEQGSPPNPGGKLLHGSVEVQTGGASAGPVKLQKLTPKMDTPPFAKSAAARTGKAQGGARKNQGPARPSGESPKKSEQECGCKPSWFTESATLRKRTYSAEDLNLIARVVYGEALGSGAGAARKLAPAELAQEKETVAGVVFNRSNANLDMSVYGIVNKPNQFTSVSKPGENAKFLSAAGDKACGLSAAECADLGKALAAVREVLETGKCSKYSNFRAYNTKGPNASPDRIGGTVFF